MIKVTVRFNIWDIYLSVKKTSGYLVKVDGGSEVGRLTYWRLFLLRLYLLIPGLDPKCLVVPPAINFGEFLVAFIYRWFFLFNAVPARLNLSILLLEFVTLTIYFSPRLYRFPSFPYQYFYMVKKSLSGIFFFLYKQLQCFTRWKQVYFP